MIVTLMDPKNISATKTAPRKEAPQPAPVEVKPPTIPTALATPPVVQNDTVEGNPKPGEATDPSLDPKFATLARKEKAVRGGMKQLQTEREAFLSEKAAFESSRAKHVSLDDLANNTLNVLHKAGVSYDTLVGKLLGQQPERGNTAQEAVPEYVQQLNAQISELKQQLLDTKKETNENRSKAYTDAVNTIRREATELVNTSEAFETIKATGAHEEVVEYIKKVHETEGIVLSVEAACKEIEDTLLEQEWSKYQRLSGTKKWKAKLTPETSVTPNAIVPQQAPGRTPVKTLTNAMGQTRPLSAKERAMLAFKGELQK